MQMNMPTVEFTLKNPRTAVPMSQLPHPTGIGKELKYWFWMAMRPLHPFLRDTLLRLGVIRHVGRQDYVLGTIAPGRTLKDFLAHLYRFGFGNHFIAWVDEGELIGLRRLDGFERQYHLRVFADGEVRGHYEFTPEYRPVAHFREEGMEERRPDFLGFLGDWIVPPRG